MLDLNMMQAYLFLPLLFVHPHHLLVLVELIRAVCNLDDLVKPLRDLGFITTPPDDVLLLKDRLNGEWSRRHCSLTCKSLAC